MNKSTRAHSSLDDEDSVGVGSGNLYRISSTRMGFTKFCVELGRNADKNVQQSCEVVESSMVSYLRSDELTASQI